MALGATHNLSQSIKISPDNHKNGPGRLAAKRNDIGEQERPSQSPAGHEKAGIRDGGSEGEGEAAEEDVVLGEEGDGLIVGEGVS